jgi:Arc/MetJ-type ribon-helix-helix transcriptional regulator
MTTVRLDTRLEATLEQLAKQRGQSKSDVIRDALEHLADEQEGSGVSALDRLSSFVGVADSGGQQLSTGTGQRFREMLVEKRRARRSR